MKVLIFALLAVAVNAANYGYGSYSGGYPSYSYSSYPSSYYGGGYGSSLYGASYGTGLGYGSGVTYGSGLGYGSGVTYGTGLGYGSGATYGTGYTGARYSNRQPQGAWEHRSGYSSGGTPGKIQFILGGAGYKTGTSDYYTPVRTKPVAAQKWFRGSTSIHRSGVSDSAPGRISFTQDFSRVSGQSGLQRSRGTVGATAFRKPVAPVAILNEKHSGVLTDHTGSFHKTGVHGNPDVHFQEVTEISGADFVGAGFGNVASQGARPKVPAVSHGFSEVHKSTSGSTGPQITWDTSKAFGDSGFTDRQPQIHTFDKVSAPMGAAVEPKIPSRSVGTVGSIHKSEVHGTTADQPRITFTQDFSKVRGQSQQIGRKPEIHSFDKPSFPVTTTVVQPSSGYIHRTGAVHRTGSQVFSSGEGPHISFIQGNSALRQNDVKTSSFDKILTPAVVRRSSTGARVTGIQSNTAAQGFSAAAGPSRITFTQDFSRVTGQNTSPVKPVISFDDKLTAPVIPAVVTSQEFQAVRRNAPKLIAPFENKPFRRPVAAVQTFKAPKQTVAEEWAVTSIQDQSPIQGLFPVRSDTDKSIFTAGHVVGFDGGVKTPNFVVVPESGVIHDKSSAFKDSTVGAVAVGKGHHATVGHSQMLVPSYGTSGVTGDKANIFVAVPADDGYGYDKSSVLLHSKGDAPAGGLLSSEEVDSGVSIQGQSFNTVSNPFKTYYSSSDPGYGRLSGKFPRFDFSPDRSLLYTYSSPHLVSPFGYSYSSGDKYYDQAGRKTVA